MASDTEAKRWVCTLCGYIHDGPRPPDSCPICATGPDLFEPVKTSARSRR